MKQRIARIRAPSADALDVSQAALKPLAEHRAQLATDPGPAGGDLALARAMGALRQHVADARVLASREFYENVLSGVARLKS
jgi:hypothetical protein